MHTFEQRGMTRRLHKPQSISFQKSKLVPACVKKQKGLHARPHVTLCFNWWASRESNTAPTDYESAALTKHELEAQSAAMAGDRAPPKLPGPEPRAGQHCTTKTSIP